MAVVAARLVAESGDEGATRVLSEELWLPAHNGVRRAGARTRVMNVLCFGNSKLFFTAHLHEALPTHVPVAVHGARACSRVHLIGTRPLRVSTCSEGRGVCRYRAGRPVRMHTLHIPKTAACPVCAVSYHERPASYMRALVARYRRGERGAMQPLLTERISRAERELCAAPRSFGARAGSARLVGYVQAHGPWEWSGTPGLSFKAGGVLQTPWGAGRWGPLGDGDDRLFADFVGSRHNLRFEPQDMGRFTSSRCGDGEPVVGKLVSQSRGAF